MGCHTVSPKNKDAVKILHVINIIDPRSGGPSNVIRHLVREQVSQGHEVSLLTTTTQTSEPWESRESYVYRMLAEPEFSEVELFIAPAIGRRRPWSRLAYSRSGERWLRRRMNDPARIPDVIHIHGVFSHVTTRAAAWARKRNVPYVVRPAGSLDAACFEMGYHRLKRAFTKVYLRKDLQYAAAIHVTSDAEAEELTHWAPTTRIANLPHGADVPQFDRHAVSEAFLDEYPQLRGKRTVLYMSRITEKKRLELLVEAIAQARQKHPELMLLVAGHDAGHGPVVREAVRRCEMDKACVFADFLAGEQKQGAFAVADFFALLSIDENFGVAVIEAMAHSLPVLVTPGVASHVYVDESNSGETVEGRLDRVVPAIERMLAADLDEMGRRGRDYIEAHLSWSSIARRLEAVYQELQPLAAAS